MKKTYRPIRGLSELYRNDKTHLCSLTPINALEILTDTLRNTPDVVLGCRIQELSELLVAAYDIYEEVKHSKHGNYDYIGSRLKHILTVREALVSDVGVMHEFNPKYDANATLNRDDVMYTTSVFMTMLYDCRYAETEKYYYAATNHIGTMMDYSRTPFVTTGDNKTLDYTKSVILTSKDIEDVYTDISNGVTFSVTTEIGRSLLSVEEITEIANTLTKITNKSEV